MTSGCAATVTGSNAVAPDLPPIPDLDTGTVSFEGFDRALHAILGRATRAVSPTSLLLAYTDWMSHLLLSPAKQVHLVQKALRKAHRLGSYLPGAVSGGAEPSIEPLAQDRRFNHPDWQRWPFNAIHQSFLLVQQWWHNATTEVRGVSRHNEEIATFAARQLLDIISPSNFLFTNPEVLRRTLEIGGGNLFQGWRNWVEAFERIQAGRPPPSRGKRIALSLWEWLTAATSVEASACAQFAVLMRINNPQFAAAHYLIDACCAVRMRGYAMNKMILAVVVAGVLAMPVMAQQTNPADKGTQATQTAPNPAEFDKRMAQIQESMKKMQEQMSKIQQTQDPQERQRLLQEHWTTMRESMGMMSGIWEPGMMGCCGGAMHPTNAPDAAGPMMHGQMMGGPMMGWSNSSGDYSKLTPEQMKQRQYMTDRYLAMQQMMMNQMMWHQHWMMGPQQQAPAPAK